MALASSDIDKSPFNISLLEVKFYFIKTREPNITKLRWQVAQVMQQFDTLESNSDEENEDDEDTDGPKYVTTITKSYRIKL